MSTNSQHAVVHRLHQENRHIKSSKLRSDVIDPTTKVVRRTTYAERKARKEEELLKKKEEVKRLKALKMKELRAKLERIGAEGGKKLEESKGSSSYPLPLCA